HRPGPLRERDRKSTRLNSSHLVISYAVFCLKKKKNLGGFFMVRSYYPSECHADYFDFERIEALKPAIEACGISTLSQSPMLGFHKQMDNRIKLLEEILSFRMQGVEFFFLKIHLPPKYTLFPYTTLFRSHRPGPLRE